LVGQINRLYQFKVNMINFEHSNHHLFVNCGMEKYKKIAKKLNKLSGAIIAINKDFKPHFDTFMFFKRDILVQK
jgi:hypothetical protein